MKEADEELLSEGETDIANAALDAFLALMEAYRLRAFPPHASVQTVIACKMTSREWLQGWHRWLLKRLDEQAMEKEKREKA